MDVRDLFSQIKIALGKMDVIVVLKKIGELKRKVPMLKKYSIQIFTKMITNLWSCQLASTI